jgi:hypothetical protein
MLTSNHLRIDPGDGSPIYDYRISAGQVEMRVVDPHETQNAWTRSEWRQLNPDELINAVLEKNVVCRWLERRLGREALLRACVGPDVLIFNPQQHAQETMMV